jgi:hypothetical protein
MVTDTKGGIGVTDLLTKWRALPLMWTEALRALVCSVPMIAAVFAVDPRRRTSVSDVTVSASALAYHTSNGIAPSA